MKYKKIAIIIQMKQKRERETRNNKRRNMIVSVFLSFHACSERKTERDVRQIVLLNSTPFT